LAIGVVNVKSLNPGPTTSVNNAAAPYSMLIPANLLLLVLDALAIWLAKSTLQGWRNA
jgi:hypothetical protein